MAAIKKRKTNQWQIDREKERERENEIIQQQHNPVNHVDPVYRKANWNTNAMGPYDGGPPLEKYPTRSIFDWEARYDQNMNRIDSIYDKRRFNYKWGDPIETDPDADPFVPMENLSEPYKKNWLGNLHGRQTPYYEHQNKKGRPGRCSGIAYANAANTLVTSNRLQELHDTCNANEFDQRKLPDYTFYDKHIAFAPTKEVTTWEGIKKHLPDFDPSKRSIVNFWVEDDPRMKNKDPDTAGHSVFVADNFVWDPNKLHGYHVDDHINTPIVPLVQIRHHKKEGFNNLNNGFSTLQLEASSDIPDDWEFKPLEDRKNTGFGIFKGLARKWKRKQFMNGQGYGRKK